MSRELNAVSHFEAPKHIYDDYTKHRYQFVGKAMNVPKSAHGPGFVGGGDRGPENIQTEIMQTGDVVWSLGTHLHVVPVTDGIVDTSFREKGIWGTSESQYQHLMNDSLTRENFELTLSEAERAAAPHVPDLKCTTPPLVQNGKLVTGVFDCTLQFGDTTEQRSCIFDPLNTTVVNVDNVWGPIMNNLDIVCPNRKIADPGWTYLPKQYLPGCTKDACVAHRSLPSAQAACLWLGSECAGVTRGPNGWETRGGSAPFDSVSGENSWVKNVEA